VVKQIRKLIEVLGAFLYEEEDTYYQEMALYKVPTEIFHQWQQNGAAGKG
jgi:acetolactate synthase I/III small subunit